MGERQADAVQLDSLIDGSSERTSAHASHKLLDPKYDQRLAPFPSHKDIVNRQNTNVIAA